MKKTLTLSQTDIKAVMAEKFKVDPDDVNIYVYEDDDTCPGQTAYKVSITVDSEVQNYDI